MFDLLSNRIKNSSGEPEVYIYDDLPKAFRNQVYYILTDIIEPYCDFKNNLWDALHDTFAREKGLKELGPYSTEGTGYGKYNIEEYLNSASFVDILDIIDLLFNFFDKSLRDIEPDCLYEYDSNRKVDEAITELNYRFKQHRLGYEFVNGEIIRIDNTVIHNNVIKPALRLLYENSFSGAEEEIRQAFEARRKGDNKKAISEANKAFESTMKTICDKKGYAYDKDKDTAQKLIGILKDEGFFPAYMSAHLTNLRTTLETGVPVTRNKNAGHGQGASVVTIPDEFAEYAINLAATNIVLLVNIYRATK